MLKLFSTEIMANSAEHRPQLTLLIPAHAIDRFTTLLQAGVIVKMDRPTSIGEFLLSLPGFNQQYIAERVETIFLDGLPVDDLSKIITGGHPVLAISAAMPGLAGAIFRKNSFHAALRTTDGKNGENDLQEEGTVSVLLKLFNIVARERGGDILSNGCFISANTLLKFIRYRSQLFSVVLHCSYDGKISKISELQDRLQLTDIIFLRVFPDVDDIEKPAGIQEK